jgi:hypothetical protein
MVGVRTAYKTLANIAVTSSVVPVTTTLTSPIAANQTQQIRFWVPFSVGATGGIRAIVTPPAGGVLFLATFKLFNTVAPSLTTAIQAASAAFTNALANAGSHWLEVEVTIVNGATAGTVDLLMAQNTSDALTMTILRGAKSDVLIS